jgi:hypothetical protein
MDLLVWCLAQETNHYGTEEVVSLAHQIHTMKMEKICVFLVLPERSIEEIIILAANLFFPLFDLLIISYRDFSINIFKNI